MPALAHAPVNQDIETPLVLGHPGIRESDSAISYLGVPLEKRTDTSHVPERERFKKHVITDFDAQLTRDLAIGLALNQPVLIEGGSGIGKTATVERMCAQLGWSCYYMNCSKFDPEVMIGGLRPVDSAESKSGFGWKDGILLQAIRNGGVLVLDEYNYLKSTAHGRLHDILDAVLDKKGKVWLAENDGEEVPIHPHFRIVGFQNSPDTRSSAVRLDNANITRFAYISKGEELPESVWEARTAGLIGESPKLTYSVGQELDYTGHQELKQIEGIDSLLRQYREFHRTIEQLVKSGELGADQSQPIYFAYQRDLNRVANFLSTFTHGNPLQTLHQALDYYYTNRFTLEEDRSKVQELIQAISLSSADDPNRVSLDPGPTAPVATSQNIQNKVTTSANDTLLRDLKPIEFFKFLRQQGMPLKDSIRALCGDGSPEANQIRTEALDQGIDKNIVLYSLAGTDGAESHEIRRRCWDQETNSHMVLFSLAGGVSEPSWATVNDLMSRIFKENKGNRALFNALFCGAIGLIGRYDEHATAARDQLKPTSLRIAKTLRTALNPLEPELWTGQESHDSELAPGVLFGVVLGGIYFPIRIPIAYGGIRDRFDGVLALSHATSINHEAQDVRNRLASRYATNHNLDMPRWALAFSLAHIEGSGAQEMRDKTFKGEGEYSNDPKFMTTSLIGIDTTYAHELSGRSWGLGESLPPFPLAALELGNSTISGTQKLRQKAWETFDSEREQLTGIFSNPYTLALNYGAQQESKRLADSQTTGSGTPP